MEDKKLLTNTELEKVAGGSAKLDFSVMFAFLKAEDQLERIIDDRADADYRNNVNHMFVYCREALDGVTPVEDTLNYMQDCCNQINIDHRLAPQNILDQLRSSLGL